MTLFFKRPKYYLVNISVNEVQVSENKSFYKPIWDFFSFCSKFDPNAPRNAVLGKWRKPHAVSTPAAMNVWTALKITTVTRRVITVTATWTVTHLDHSLRLIFCLYESHFGLFFHLGEKKSISCFSPRWNSSEISFYLRICSVISVDMQPIHSKDVKVTHMQGKMTSPPLDSSPALLKQCVSSVHFYPCISHIDMPTCNQGVVAINNHLH